MSYKIGVEEKLKNLPRIYVNSFEKNEGRREVLRSHFFNLGIDNYSFVTTTLEQDKTRNFVGNYHYKLDPKIYLVTAAYLETIRHWYETTDEECALFFEDDAWLETARYWNFTWNDFMNHLPNNWECIHLGSVYPMGMNWHWNQLNPYIRKSCFSDSMLMSMIRRPYAKKLIDNYIVGKNTYDLSPKNPNFIDCTFSGKTSFAETNLAETVIYMSGSDSYRILLFSANPYYSANSTIRPEDFLLYFGESEEPKPVSLICSRFSKSVIEWWEKIGYQKTVQEMTKLEAGECLPVFDWGNLHPMHASIISEEIFENKIYEKHVKVKQGDVVLDIGANCGAFTYSIMKSNPSHVYCIEPSNNLIHALTKNTNECPVTIINKAIASSDDDCKSIHNRSDVYQIFAHTGDTYSAITFKKFIEDYKIEKVDFMKFDCEGGEYFIFTEENEDYIKNNIAYAVGEWHMLSTDFSSFISFRERYLKPAKFFHVYDRWENDITESILDDDFVKTFHENMGGNDYGQMSIYVSWK
jgi:FkbM family methyltransferase